MYTKLVWVKHDGSCSLFATPSKAINDEVEILEPVRHNTIAEARSVAAKHGLDGYVSDKSVFTLTGTDKVYAGIGSRETPQEVLSQMRTVAKMLACLGYTLRSGHADGADLAFEDGCDSVDAKLKEIFIPWRGFNDSASPLHHITSAGLTMAEQYHPNWEACSRGARYLHARNCYQILGARLDTPVRFVLCYTKGGEGRGGTGQALRLAHFFHIPVFDFGVYEGDDVWGPLSDFLHSRGVDDNSVPQVQ